MWYNRLRLFLVSFFDHLAREFEFHFLANVQPKPSMAMLLGLRQKEDKSLSLFVTHFAIVMQGVPYAHPVLVTYLG
ncbi:hypothetical protein C4D60_Mb06t36870 [Musa balbisiana]|uniref:Retrotransposon gag domain-containing protein n=1 Tax=Musa balbisiana TaxID=52838 RepID=A0A4S8ITB1_MUSBA|nr:hypothetical protein C4D60_Mb06t36870 [Musa balbisiana]